MAINYATAVKNARLAVVRAAVDNGSGNGRLVLLSAGSVVLASIGLAKPSFDDPAGGMMTLAGLPKQDDDADASGTPTTARFEDSDGNVIASGLSVGISGTDVIVSSATIAAGNEVRVDSATIVHA